MHTTKAYPVQKFATMTRDAQSEFNGDMLWHMQQNVYDAKVALMRKMYEEGYVPVDDDFDTEIFVEVKCYVKRRGIDGEATDGRWITLPASMQHIVVASPFDKPIYEVV